MPRQDTQFQPGKSGNPGGRPVGSGNQIRTELAKAWEDIKPVLLERAVGGDMAAIRIVAERVCPPIRATEPASPIELPKGTLTDRANAVLDSLGQGDLSTGQAAQLMQALGSLAKVIETDELTRRIEALEAKSK